MVLCPPLTVLVRLFLAWCSLQSLFSSPTPFFSPPKRYSKFWLSGVGLYLDFFPNARPCRHYIQMCIKVSGNFKPRVLSLVSQRRVFRRIRKWLWAIEFRGYQVWGHVQADAILNYEATSRYLERFILQMQIPLATQRKHSRVPPSSLFPVCFLSIFLISFP